MELKTVDGFDISLTKSAEVAGDVLEETANDFAKAVSNHNGL